MDRPTLVLHDATEFNYTTHRSLKNLGQIGSGHGRGYIAQNSLAVDPKTREAFGLCNQVLHRRPKIKKGETTAQKRKRKSRESQEDCKVIFLTAKDAKSAKEMLAMGIFQGFLLGALGVLGGSFRFIATLQFS